MIKKDYTLFHDTEQIVKVLTPLKISIPDSPFSDHVKYDVQQKSRKTVTDIGLGHFINDVSGQSYQCHANEFKCLDGWEKIGKL